MNAFPENSCVFENLFSEAVPSVAHVDKPSL